MTASAATLDAHLRELLERALIALRDLPLALHNQREAMAGYPTSTPGANRVSGPGQRPEYDTDGNVLEPVRLTVVERLAGERDPARAARDRIETLVLELTGVPITELYSTIETWAYPTGRPPIDEDEDHDWCKSCLRLDKCEPRAAGQYKDVCRWCGDFRAAEGQLPPIELLQARHGGNRITAAMVVRALQRQRATPKKKRRKRAA